jgi:hypothetical protein
MIVINMDTTEAWIVVVGAFVFVVITRISVCCYEEWRDRKRYQWIQDCNNIDI